MKYSFGTSSSSLVKTSLLTNSRKQRVVASTSAVALCASAKGTLNKYSCNSVKVGSLNFPPRPPGSCNNEAVTSVQVSKTGIEAIVESTPILWNSAPIIFTSKPKFCPTMNLVLLKAILNFSKTSAKVIPSASANSVEIPWIRSASYGMLNPSGFTK